MNDMMQVAYCSSVSSMWRPIDTGVILQTSRYNNALRDITGLLLFDKGRYLQVIEGSASAVAELYKDIRCDERHCGIFELFRQPILEREFLGWSMAYQELNTIGPALRDYNFFLQNHFDIQSLSVAEAKSLLRLFKRPSSPVMLACKDSMGVPL